MYVLMAAENPSSAEAAASSRRLAFRFLKPDLESQHLLETVLEYEERGTGPLGSRSDPLCGKGCKDDRDVVASMAL